MILVSIFALRDVIRKVQSDFKIPYNGISHTSPSIGEDIAKICEYLEQHELQSYKPERENNEYAIPVRDLIVAGATYNNTARPFKNFRADTRNTKNLGTKQGAEQALDDTDYTQADIDLGGELDLDISDLAMDDEEFPVGTNPTDFIAMAREAIEEFSRYD
jgi:hypothetical protein